MSKRPREEDSVSLNSDDDVEPTPKKPRVEPVAPGRWRMVIVEVGEEFDGTCVHVVEGDDGGLADFKTLIVESTHYDDEVSYPVTGWALTSMELEAPDKGFPKRFLPYWKRFRDLYVKYNLKHTIEDWDVGAFDCNAFARFSGVY
jgi:hypothetical protein